jgi:hypothetical protein
MLQASTGKLFTHPIGHKNVLRGVLYTNMVIYSDDDIDISLGKILPLSMRRQPNVVACEIVENIESAGGIGPGVLHSNGIDIYLSDFADIISFHANVICTPDAELANRLLNEKPRPGTIDPKKLVARTFENDVYISSSELNELRSFSTDLLGLSRKQYLLAIKAIRTYVTALHRLSENLDLAYTLLVMSIEALVSDVGEYESQWSDVDEKKRAKLEDILEDVNEEISEKIKSAIVDSEHLSLTKKFNHFILSNLPEDYFSDNAALHANPIGKADLYSALPNLYNTRSKYVHELKALPKEFSHFSGTAETTLIDDKLLLTLQGLTRLARTVIKTFISKQEKVEAEPCDYNLENPNIARIKFCPSTWISAPDGLNSNNCSMYFAGFIILLDQYLSTIPNGTFYDVRVVIEKGFSIKGKLDTVQRTSIIALAALFSGFVSVRHKPNIKISKQDKILIDTPSIQALITLTALGRDTEWSISDHEREFDSYYKTRLKATGFRLPHRLEACLGLAFAERLRASGEHERAVLQLCSTADNFPTLKAIRELSENYNSDTPISWLKIIYPNIVTIQPQATLECNGL